MVEKIRNKVKNPPTLDEMKEAIKAVSSEIAAGSAKVVDKIKTEAENAPNLDEIKKILSSAPSRMAAAGSEVAENLKPKVESIMQNLNVLYSTITSSLFMKFILM